MTTTQYPQLVFLSGPQAGQRVVLATGQAVLGRGAAADVPLAEDFASRQHARYELLEAGPTIENLSPKGTMINGKRYKAGKKILLATGDVIGVGSETEILFVSAGDDADAAAAALLSGPTRRNAFGKTVPTAEAAEQDPPIALVEEPRAPAEPGQAEVIEKRPSEMTAGEREAIAAKQRRKKLLMGLGVWWGVIVVGGLVLAIFVKPPPKKDLPVPRMIGQSNVEETKDGLIPPLENIVAEMRSCLNFNPHTPRFKLAVNPAARDQWLEKAVDTYRQSGRDVGSRLKALDAFNQSIGYSGLGYLQAPRAGPSQGELSTMYEDVLSGVAQELAERYHGACLAEAGRDWKDAERRFSALLDVLPNEDAAYPPGKSVYDNVRLHQERVKAYTAQLTKKKTGPMGM